MASNDPKDRKTEDLTGQQKTVPRDRDQSAISPERAHDAADKAEFPETANLPRPELGDALTARDNFEDKPEEDDKQAARRTKP